MISNQYDLYELSHADFINNLIVINPDKIQDIIDYNKDYEITYLALNL